jgi:hypothetical protein
MASVTLTIPSGTNPRAVVNRLWVQLRELEAGMNDVTSGAATVLTFDNGPTQGSVSVELTSGPQPNTGKKVKA